MKHNAWLFDIDGVLTDPVLKKVTQPETLKILVDLIKDGDLVAFNTGRSSEFVLDNIINPLKLEMQIANVSSNFFASCEKSAVVIISDKEDKVGIDTDIVVPQVVKDKVYDLVESAYKDRMFFDSTKKTMVTLEMNDGLVHKLFVEAQPVLGEKMLKILDDHDIKGEFMLDYTTIAIDMQHIRVGKKLGVEKFVDWVKQKDKSIDKITMFGDSLSDLEMIDGAVSMGIDYEFVFVGGEEKIKKRYDKIPDKILYTKNIYEKGVIEYFKNK